MELLKHVAKHHSQGQDQEMKLHDEEKTENEAKKEDVQKDKHQHKETVEETEVKDNEKENAEKDIGMALSESMLDDVLLAGY